MRKREAEFVVWKDEWPERISRGEDSGREERISKGEDSGGEN